MIKIHCVTMKIDQYMVCNSENISNIRSVMVQHVKVKKHSRLQVRLGMFRRPENNASWLAHPTFLSKKGGCRYLEEYGN